MQPGAAAGREAAAAPAAQTAQVHGNLAQVMRGILYPASNVIFFAQSEDPTTVKTEGDAVHLAQPAEQQLRRVGSGVQRRDRAVGIREPPHHPGTDVHEREAGADPERRLADVGPGSPRRRAWSPTRPARRKAWTKCSTPPTSCPPPARTATISTARSPAAFLRGACRSGVGGRGQGLGLSQDSGLFPWTALPPSP